MARILLVDDELSLRVTLREFLLDADYDVDLAADAREAMEKLEPGVFDLVVINIIMPRVTGVHLLEKIKERSPNVQVILMTGEPMVETVSTAVRAGAFDYLAKPISKEHLLRTVASAVRLKSLHDERRRLARENQQHRDRLEHLVAERRWHSAKARNERTSHCEVQTSGLGIGMSDQA